MTSKKGGRRSWKIWRTTTWWKNRFTAQKDTWFRTGGTTSTTTVLASLNGLLSEKIRNNLKRGRQPTGTRVAKDGGVSAQMGPTCSNQFPRERCHRMDCILCFQKEGSRGGTNCSQSNVGYEGRCSRCQEVFAYMGEMSRTAYTRLGEHLANYRAAAAARLPPLPPDEGAESG